MGADPLTNKSAFLPLLSQDGVEVAGSRLDDCRADAFGGGRKTRRLRKAHTDDPQLELTAAKTTAQSATAQLHCRLSFVRQSPAVLQDNPALWRRPLFL